jgi:hypothetical protein
MDFDEMVYQETFEINGHSYLGLRNRKTSEVKIPYTDPPNVSIGDVIKQSMGASSIDLRVLDVQYSQGGTLEIGTNHPHLLIAEVENLTSTSHRSPKAASTINIGSISSHQVQVGDHNSQVSTVTLSEVVQKVAASGDDKARGLLRSLLENNTVAAIVGASATSLISALGG